MQDKLYRSILIAGIASMIAALGGCGAQPGLTNATLTNSSANRTNTTVSNTVNSNSAVSSTAVETREPEQYQARVTLKLEAIGAQQTTALPTLTATVARNAVDRRMEFEMPAGGRVVYLDKAGTNYLVLPDKKQYAELNRESLGFDVRRMLMPEQIVQQVKGVKGVERIGEETYNGRSVIKYRYGAVANTGSQAGEVSTESFLYVDKDTNLPLHSETVSQTQSGANVQGYKGLRVITEIGDIKTDAPAELFQPPTDFQKIESSQVRSQVDMIFSALASLLTQMMQGTQATGANTSPTAKATP